MKPKSVFACINTNLSVRINSSSGGFFSLLAEDILLKKGVIYGVKMSDDCYSAEYARVTDIEDLDILRRSKYLQAKIGDTYSSVKKDLLMGRYVLFSGTGCSIIGLRSFLGKDFENLILVDFVCHGVPSPSLWKKHAKYQEKKYKGKLKAIYFRCKEKHKWSETAMKYEFQENKEQKKIVFTNFNDDYFMQMFNNNFCLRPSCYNCTAKIIKFADITIADFWGIDKVIKRFNDEKGTSLVLIRTRKGSNAFKALSNKMKYVEVSYKDVLRYNPSECKSAEKPRQRDSFYEDLLQMNYIDLYKKYSISKLSSIITRIQNKIKRILGQYINCVSRKS